MPQLTRTEDPCCCGCGDPLAATAGYFSCDNTWCDRYGEHVVPDLATTAPDHLVGLQIAFDYDTGENRPGTTGTLTGEIVRVQERSDTRLLNVRPDDAPTRYFNPDQVDVIGYAWEVGDAAQ